MLITDLPNLDKLTYGRAAALKREIAEFVTYCEMHPTSSATALEAWWLTMNTGVSAKLAAASP